MESINAKVNIIFSTILSEGKFLGLTHGEMFHNASYENFLLMLNAVKSYKTFEFSDS